MWISLSKPEITGKHSAKRKQNNTYWKPKEYWIPKYTLSWVPVVTFSLPGGRFALLPPPVTPFIISSKFTLLHRRIFNNMSKSKHFVKRRLKVKPTYSSQFIFEMRAVAVFVPFPLKQMILLYFIYCVHFCVKEREIQLILKFKRYFHSFFTV